MINDGRFNLTEQDGIKLLRLIGQLKEATAELLATRYAIITDDALDEMPSLSELTFYDHASNILATVE